MIQQERMKFMLERIHRAWQIQGCVCNVDGVILAMTADDEEKVLSVSPDAGLIKELYEKCRAGSLPVVAMEEDMVYYMAFLDEEERMYLIGPIAAEKLTFSQYHTYRRRHGITEQNYRIPYLPPTRALACLSMVYYMVTGRMVSEKELMQENKELEKIPDREHSFYQLQQDSEENRRFSYRNEKEWLARIENGVVPYQEGLFIGYRYYESKKMPVRFPFGYGLSYTAFTYHDLSVDKEKLDESESVRVSVQVTNTGSVTGKAVIQLYVAPEKAEAVRPVRELKAFDKIELQPGETKEVMFVLEPRAFQHWNTVVHNWRTEQGKYVVQIGENARDIVLTKEIFIEADPVPPSGGYSPQMAIGEFAKSKKAHAFLDENIIFMIKGMAANGYIPQEAMAMLEQVPGGISLDMINAMASRMGHRSGAGLDVLMAQSLGVFEMFLPEEKKQELRELIQKLNEQ